MPVSKRLTATNSHSSYFQACLESCRQYIFDAVTSISPTLVSWQVGNIKVAVEYFKKLGRSDPGYLMHSNRVMKRYDLQGGFLTGSPIAMRMVLLK